MNLSVKHPLFFQNKERFLAWIFNRMKQQKNLVGGIKNIKHKETDHKRIGIFPKQQRIANHYKNTP